MSQKGGKCKKGSMTGKRSAEDESQGQQESGGRGSKQARTAAEAGDDEGLLPGPKLGGGPVWRVRAGKGASDADKDGDEGLYRCGMMLEQALSCSAFSDVKFVFDDEESGVRGHRAMLCSVSQEFCGMFESGMAEAKSGEVRVRGVSRESFRGFLELLYLGRAGEEMARADGREVWVLADLYDVRGMKEWLMGEGLAGGSVCAALQYGMEGGGFLEELVEACKKCAACEGLCVIGEESLRGVSCDAARVVLEAFLGRWPGRVVEGFEYVCRWAKVNGGLVCGNGDVDSLVGVIELGKMRTQDLQNIVRPSGLVRDADLLDMYQHRGVGEDKVEGKRLGAMKVFGSGGDGPGQLENPNYVAVGWKDGEQRMAVSDCDMHRVLVFDVGSGECVLTLGSEEEEGPEFFEHPSGVAFNHRGDIIVADSEHHRICVFDWQGQFVREFGRHGAGNGEFDSPEGVAVNAHGDILVSDYWNHRVQIFGSDGAFKLSFGSHGQGHGQFEMPEDVAVGPDGMLVVADSNSRIQVFSGVGSHVRTIGSRGEGQEQLMRPRYVGVSTHGEILVVDKQRHVVQVFSKDGVYLRSIGKDDIGTADEFDPQGVCVDAEGHVFVCAAKNVVMLG